MIKNRGIQFAFLVLSVLVVQKAGYVYRKGGFTEVYPLGWREQQMKQWFVPTNKINNLLGSYNNKKHFVLVCDEYILPIEINIQGEIALQ